ncbi:helix-turn-helix domain-containing protein [Catellatospora coxensis]|uniref:MerR family transcriptional regulator n=1 Tax=Catellatospora coxensis TaxID=310354 RepID=A0A8J3P8H7_9ACTN|nr:helix-turn-helix domain-containing protein [Catellatospora coxensis]GIG05711.1 MerR family transcriptional regulator [Catellatospora coxensis]
MADLPRPLNRAAALGDASYPGYAMNAAASAIGVTPAFLRSAETAGLFEVHRSEGGHRRYSRDDLHRAERARALVDDGVRLDAAVRIVSLEYQLAAANAMIELLRRKDQQPKRGPQE